MADGWYDPFSPSFKGIVVFLKLAKLYLSILPNILLWVEVRRIVRPARKNLDAMLREGSLGSRSMQQVLTIDKELESCSTRKSFLEKRSHTSIDQLCPALCTPRFWNQKSETLPIRSCEAKGLLLLHKLVVFFREPSLWPSKCWLLLFDLGHVSPWCPESLELWL